MTEILSLRPMGVGRVASGEYALAAEIERSREIRVCRRCGARRVRRA